MYSANDIFQIAIPEDAVQDDSDDEDEKVNPDERLPQAAQDKRVSGDNEFSESEDEGEGGRRDNRNYNKQRKRPRLEQSSSGAGGGGAGGGATSPDDGSSAQVKDEIKGNQKKSNY